MKIGPDRIPPSAPPGDLPSDINQSYRPGQTSILQQVQSGMDIIPSSDQLEILESQQRLVEWIVEEIDEGQAVHSKDETSSTHNQFTLRNIIGKGGFAEIWRATQTSLGRLVAVKRMRNDLFDQSVNTPSSIKQVELSFRQEALTTALLDHPNIVPVHDIGLDKKGRTLLAMKLVRGRSWESMLEEDWKNLAEQDYYAKHLPILVQMTQAVSFAHSRGVLHRDLKPSQVMIGEFGEVTLMDWGLAVVYEVDKMITECSHSHLAAVAPTIEAATNPAGTIAFMAPEQTEHSAKNLGIWTDIYLLGGTLYYLLTGTVPHRAPGNVVAFYKASQGVVEHPQKRAPNRLIPNELAELCMRALNAKREERTKSAKEFIQQLEGYLSGAGEQAESRRITALAEETLVLPTATYEDFGRALARLERASVLWARNPDCNRLTNAIAARFAATALENGDLQLGRMQIERIEEGEIREKLAHDLKQLELRIRENVVIRKRLRGATIIFGVMLLGTLVLYFSEQKRTEATLADSNTQLRIAIADAEAAKEVATSSANSAEVARLHAEEERTKSEQLVNFLVSDFYKELNSLGRVGVLEKIANELSDYYIQAQAAQDITPAGLENKALAFRILGGVRRAQGRSDIAEDILQRSREISEKLLLSEPQNNEYKFQLGKAFDALGKQARYTNDFETAIQRFSHAVNVFTPLRTEHPDDRNNSVALAESLHGLAATYLDIGDLTEAQAYCTQAEQLYEKLLEKNASDSDLVITLAAINDTAATIEWQTNQVDSALAAQDKALEQRQQFSRQQPWNLQLQRLIGWNRRLTGDILSDEKRFPEAEQSYNTAMETMLRLETYDPDSVMRKLDAAGLLTSLANLYRELHSNETAMDRLAQANNLLDEILKLEPTNIQGNIELAHMHLVRGRVLLETNSAGSTEEFQKAVTILEAMDSTIAKSKNLYLGILARSLLLLDRKDEAIPVLQELAKRHYRDRLVFEIAKDKGLIKPEPGIPNTIELL